MIKIQEIFYTLIMGFLMSLFITLVLSFIRLGLTPHFFYEWISVWIYTYPIVLVCMLILKPLALAITNFLMKFID